MNNISETTQFPLDSKKNWDEIEDEINMNAIQLCDLNSLLKETPIKFYSLGIDTEEYKNVCEEFSLVDWRTALIEFKSNHTGFPSAAFLSMDRSIGFKEYINSYIKFILKGGYNIIFFLPKREIFTFSSPEKKVEFSKIELEILINLINSNTEEYSDQIFFVRGLYD